ncbi:SDR family oxidoreductase [Humibacter soli]
MTALNVLFIGGTGIISRWCAQQAVAAGMNVDIITRAKGRPIPDGVRALEGDIADEESIARLIAGTYYDVVIDWLVFEPEHVYRDHRLFADKTRQYVFISSASAYQTPPERLPITERTPLSNPYWAYSRAKIECETALASLASTGFPVTVVRPSHTYDHTMVPFDGGWTVVDRMRRGQPIIIPGDGTSLWTMTHSRDFAVGFTGLLGNPRAIGETFHITSDDPMTWNHIYASIANAAGVEPDFIHVASDAIAAAHPEWGAALLGDKSQSMIFDNTKIKELVPAFAGRCTDFTSAAQEIINWHDADPGRKAIDPSIDQAMDALAIAYRPRSLRIPTEASR